ncbi:HAD family phosphatase [Cryobacterium tepidiphilum]|uniref:HAD family phosphatase n=1 Tax=Cryobacterium tepidiphilum TaxID=2486026 RepID=UPI001F2D1585|nr:HAD family phosphatase [Cryobacterium tepidiphilum]
MGGDVYFFDCDKTLYAYDFRKRLPTLARLVGSSQYHLAKTWWVGGHERAANAGEYNSAEEYLDAWREVTGTTLTLAQWQEARAAAMTRIPGRSRRSGTPPRSARCRSCRTNPIPFRDSLPMLAPDVSEILEVNDLTSAVLGAEKPQRRICTRRLTRKHGAYDVDGLVAAIDAFATGER